MRISFPGKVLALVGLYLMSLAAIAATEPVWSIKEGIQTPESAYFDAKSETLYVSNVAGSPAEKDGKGWISKFDAKGKVVQAQWVTGLDAPKGLRASGDTLWVSNIDELISIDIPSGKITQRIPIKGSKFLNDVAVAPGGEVYVSDMLGGKIYVVKDGKPKVFVQGKNFEMPNGLLIHEGKLIVAGWGTDAKPDFTTKTPGNLYSIDLKTKKKTKITKKPLGNLDGVEMTSNGNFWVSDWIAGKVYRVNAQDGTSQVVLDGFKGAADLGYVSGSNTLIVPRMGEDQVSAYQVP